MTERPGLIGRGRELATLEQALDDAEHSGSGWVSVVGEPGIGKTRLVGELCARTEARGGLALAGGGSELELDLPYGAFADAFDDYLGALDPGRLKTVLGVEIDALAGVFPALARHAQAGSELSGQRHRIHRTVRALLGRLADDRSFVLALDDLHWADLASLELILYLTRHPPPGNGLLLVLTWRASADNRLGAALASGRSARHAAVELAPLTQPELAELVGVDMDAARLGAIYRASGGNPFYAEELARLGPNAGPDEHDAGLPRSVAGAIGSEVAGLPAAARRLAQAAAVAGDPFGPELAAACAALDEREALAALDQLLARTIIISAGSPRRFRFRHPIVRLAVYESAGVGWRLAAHARAAAALAEWGAPLTARAHHLALAAAPGDDDAAQLLADAAAGVQAHAPATAAGWLQAALRLLPQQAEHEQHRCELLSTLAAALGAQGQLVQARAALLEAVNTCPRRAGLVADLAGIEHALGHFDQSGPRLRAALARLPAGAATERARLGVELAFSRLAHLDFEGALEQAALAAELATDLNPPLYGAARAMGAFVAAAAALPQAREQRLQAAAIIDTLDDHELQRQLAGAYYLGRAEHLLEDLEASARHLGRAITVARASGSSAQLVLLGREHARVLAFCGRLNEARQEAETALASARISGQPWALGCALTAHATVLRSTGELDDAIASAEEAVSLIATGTVPAAAVLEVGIRRQLALIALDTGQPERCLQELTRLGLPERGPAEPSVLCELYEAATAAELACGRLDAAQAWAEAAEHVATRLELPLSRALALSAQGRCQLAAGHPQRAAQAALKAAAGASSAGAHLQAARCQLLAGEALIESGQLETAEQELQSAATAFARSGARRDHERAATQLRRLGATVAAPLPAHPLGADLRTLSAREREIAELVARGHTNRRIAAELYISRKTVETHLRNIFEKLAVHNRTSMVRILERDRRTAI